LRAAISQLQAAAEKETDELRRSFIASRILELIHLFDAIGVTPGPAASASSGHDSWSTST
jgi:hypothetical protein